MKFPYGICDFYKIMTENYFYVDRTSRIRLIEEIGPQLLFLRPRRFGKSLLLSMLENYYDVARADEFETLFGHLAIGQNPTPRHNQYFVLKWDFSGIDSWGDVSQIRQALHNHINGCIEQFAVYYRDLLNYDLELNPTDALRSLQSVLAAVQQTPYQLYLLIDEYDNFANEVMMASQPTDRERYESLLYGEGLLKTIFKAVKAASAGRGLDRVFITGVSPVVLSDITSGYNVAENIYFKPQFNDLCGFWESEIQSALKEMVKECNLPVEQAAQALSMMRTFYNGYAFSPGKVDFVYNPTLALYFMKNFQEICQSPEEILDSNLTMDREKLAYISKLPGGGQLILDALNEDQPLTVQRLANRFSLADMLAATKDRSFMASLLYYFGILTFGGRTVFGELILKIPNLVVRELYVACLQDMLLPDAQDKDEGRQAARTLYQTGDLQPLCDFVEQRYFKAFDNRDYLWANELTIKTAFLTLLFNDLFYIIDSETALERSYADLTLILRPEMRRYQLLDLLLEFKYVSLAEAGLTGDEAQTLRREQIKDLAPVQQKLQAAQTKLRSYRQILQAHYGEPLRLRSYAVVSLGFERLVWAEASEMV